MMPEPDQPPRPPRNENPSAGDAVPPIPMESAGIATPALGTVGPGTPQRKRRYLFTLVVAAVLLGIYILLQPRSTSRTDSADPRLSPNAAEPAARDLVVPQPTAVEPQR